MKYNKKPLPTHPNLCGRASTTTLKKDIGFLPKLIFASAATVVAVVAATAHTGVSARTKPKPVSRFRPTN